MQIAAIPTIYGGTLFRSNLEAHWAAFFDLIDWKYVYEPNEFSTLRKDRRGHIPDFALPFKSRTVMASVKPYTRLSEMQEFTKKEIDPIAWNGEWVIIGSTPFSIADTSYEGVIGYLSQDFLPKGICDCESFEKPHGIEDCGRSQGIPIRGWDEGCINVCRNPALEPHFGLYHQIQSYHCYACDYHDGSSASFSPSMLSTLWNYAGNAVRWKRKEKPSHLMGERLSGPKWIREKGEWGITRKPLWEFVW